MFVLNESELHNSPLLVADRTALGEEAEREVESLLCLCPLYAPTPLVDLPGLAARLGLRSLVVKDESQRLRLGSFKALGGAYAVIRHVLERAGFDAHRCSLDHGSFPDARLRKLASAITVACATDGNHGRAVASGARLIGCRAIIFVPKGVSANRVEAIRALGAEIELVEGTYDDAVAAAFLAAQRNGWELISDTAWEGYEATPLKVMQGYTVMVAEVLRGLDQVPTHVFLQAGVGGLAAAVAAHLALRLGDSRPKVVIVEPERAPCVIAAQIAGHPIRVPETSPTVMAMLECYEASLVATRILARTADAFMTVTEEDAVDAVRMLASPSPGDPALVSGESGAAGLAGLLRAKRDRALWSMLGLTRASRVLLFSTEGATDPDIHAELTVAMPAALARNGG